MQTIVPAAVLQAIITTEEFQLSVWGDARITVTLENRPVTTVQGPQASAVDV